MAEQILVIDGEAIVRDTLARVLTREGFHVELADGAGAPAAIAPDGPDLAIGLAASAGCGLWDALAGLKVTRPSLRAIVIGHGPLEALTPRARQVGVEDLLARPFEMDDLIARVRRHVAALQVERERNTLLERLRANVVTMVDSLAMALEARDPYTAGHSQRVAEFSLAIGRELGLSHLELELLRHGAALHDIGKIAVSQEVLHKPGRLSDEEYEHIKIHPVVGREILAPIADFAAMLDLVYYHHERIDGRGYPEGLKGPQIPLLAQIVAVADTYDAMTSDRPYRLGMAPEKALAILEEVAGTQLNPAFVQILVRQVRAGQWASDGEPVAG